MYFNSQFFPQMGGMMAAAAASHHHHPGMQNPAAMHSMNMNMLYTMDSLARQDQCNSGNNMYYPGKHNWRTCTA
jgi:hypothetical protein